MAGLRKPDSWRKVDDRWVKDGPMTIDTSDRRENIDVAAAILAARPGIADVMITHRFPLDAVGEAFATARDRASGAIKVVLEP